MHFAQVWGYISQLTTFLHGVSYISYVVYIRYTNW